MCIRDSSTVELIKEYESCMETEGNPGLEELLARMEHEKAWDYERKAKQILSQLKIRDFSQQIKHLSGGQLKRVALANVLITEPDFLILDEPTSGLDPVVRAEMLDIFLEFISDGKRSILVSSHITSDLERIADYITFIHQGRLLMSKNKDELLYGYAIAKADRQTLHAVDSRLVEVMQDTPYGSQALVNDREQFARRYPDILLDSLTLDEMMLMLCRNKQ